MPEKIIVSTSNIMAAGVMGWPSPEKSNTELITSLESSFSDARTDGAETDGASHGSSYANWTSTSKDGKTLYIPTLDFTYSALQEEREQYDITVKLFFLPNEDKSARMEHAREAIDLVLKELHVDKIDLLIAAFPGIYFDEESEDCPDKISSRGPEQADPEPLPSQTETWEMLENLHKEGLVLRLGLSEFGAERLEPFLEKVETQPSVNQVNLRNCCSVPKNLSSLAKSRNIELLVHNDCTNILPRGTMRKLLDEEGADVLGAPQHKLNAGQKRKRNEGSDGSQRLEGEVEPQWVVKYTAVVKNRGVVENKGYFACATYLE